MLFFLIFVRFPTDYVLCFISVSYTSRAVAASLYQVDSISTYNLLWRSFIFWNFIWYKTLSKGARDISGDWDVTHLCGMDLEIMVSGMLKKLHKWNPVIISNC